MNLQNTTRLPAFSCLVLAFLLLLAACSAPSGSGGESPSPTAAEEALETVPPTEESAIPEGLMAARVGNVEISMEEFNFHYLTAYYWFDNSGYASMLGISDPSQLGDVPYDDETTWAQIIAEDALSSLQLVVAESEAARELGLTMSDELQSELEATLAGAESTAASAGKSLQDYLPLLFGQNMTPEIYRACLERIFLANTWTGYATKDVDLSDTALMAYYDEHRDEFDAADFNVFFVNASLYDEEGYEVEGDEQTRYTEERFQQAEEMLGRLTLDNFAEISVDYLEEDEIPADCFAQGVSVSALQSVEGLYEFITDESRVTGDAELFAQDGGWYVIQYIRRYLPEDYTVNVRHILVLSETENAAERAEELYTEWQQGAGDEESFAELAALYTDDTGSQSTGGLYENVGKGEMVEAFDAWCFDPARKEGDSGIVETEYGYHVMYFVNRGEAAWKSAIRDSLSASATEAARAPLLENMTYELYDVMEYVGR